MFGVLQARSMLQRGRGRLGWLGIAGISEEAGLSVSEHWYFLDPRISHRATTLGSKGRQARSTRLPTLPYLLLSLRPLSNTRSLSKMSMLAALRMPARRAAFNSAPRFAARSSMRSSFRKYSTESTPPPPPKSNTALYAALGGVAVAGVGYFIYASSDSAKEAGTAAKSAGQAVKVAANFVPTKEDYQKVSCPRQRSSHRKLICFRYTTRLPISSKTTANTMVSRDS